MTNEQERAFCEEIRAKMERGEELTERERRIFAYSPYGTAAGCASCAGGPKVTTPQKRLVDFEELEIVLPLQAIFGGRA